VAPWGVRSLHILPVPNQKQPFNNAKYEPSHLLKIPQPPLNIILPNTPLELTPSHSFLLLAPQIRGDCCMSSAGRVAQGVDSEFKPQYHKKKKTTTQKEKEKQTLVLQKQTDKSTLCMELHPQSVYSFFLNTD
jgi:hypothetical protein